MTHTDSSTYRRISSNTYTTNNELSVMLWDAGNGLFIDGGLEAAGFAAALRGDDFGIYHKDSDNAWGSDHTVDYFPVDDTDAGSYVTLAEHDVAVITMFYLQLETLSDSIHVEIGYFSDATPGVASDNASFTNSLGFNLATVSGSAASGVNSMQPVPISPPIIVAQSVTASCIGFRVKVGDTDSEACIGARGFIMRNLDEVKG